MCTTWDPEEALATEHPDVTIHHVPAHQLPPDTLAVVHYREKRVDVLAGQPTRQRLCTLAHEYVHIQRGPVPGWLTPREERTVDQIAARLLISDDALADALTWCRDEHELADMLHVDVPTMIARLEGLSDAETREVNRRLDEAELRIP